MGAVDITFGAGNLTMNVVGPVTQVAGNVITASGLQLLCSSRGRHTSTTRDWSSDVCSSDLTISYTDANALLVGTVTDGPSGMTSSGINSSNHDVKLTV